MIVKNGHSISLGSTRRGVVAKNPKRKEAISPGSLLFNDPSQFLQLPRSEVISILAAEPFTIEAWIKPTSIKTIATLDANGNPDPLDYGDIIIGDTEGGGNNWSLQLFNNKLTFYRYKNTAEGFRFFTSNSEIQLNAWTHVAVSYDGGSTLSIFINGTLDRTFVDYSPPDTQYSVITIGNLFNTGTLASGNGAFAYKGYITNLRINDNQFFYQYIGSFEPTAPLGYISGTTLMLLAKQNEPIKDSGPSNITITNVGSVNSSSQYPTVADCANNDAKVLMVGWFVGPRVLTRTNENLYSYFDETLYRTNTSSPWIYTNLGTPLATSSTVSQFPWQAVWPSPYTATKVCPQAPPSLWNLFDNPSNKTINNFNVIYTGGQVDIDWGGVISANISSNTNINNTFSGITRLGISVISKNGANISHINCGTSSPKLGGNIDLSAFPNLTDFTCRENDITAISGYENNPNTRLINFSINTVSGTIPSLSGLSNLQEFYCHTNKLSGTIPSLIGLSNLTNFCCHTNKLSGTIPNLDGLSSLQTFACQTNQLSGPIPTLTGVSNLRYFRCYENKLNGAIPSLSGLNNLTVFQCQTNQLSGTIPTLSGSPYLIEFYCNTNQLRGPIPSLNALSGLQIFSCQTNQLTGTIPTLTGLSSLQTFTCQDNLLTGPIPSLSGLNNLQTFRCYTNRLSGTIPNLDGLSSLQTFACQTNQLSGSIPSLDGLSNLQYFSCQANNLSGFIPSLSSLSNLIDFRCHINQLSGSIPVLSGLNKLQIFYCYTNRLTGFDGGVVSNTLGNFQAQNNLFTSSTVNTILSTFVAANKLTGTRILNLGGTNAAPTDQGITDKATLISRGWTITTN